MDAAVLSAVSGLAGSLIGAGSSIVASWLSHHYDWQADARKREAGKREALYAEFITEASRRFTDAVGHQAEGPEAIVALYAAVGRMRLMSSRQVIDAAEGLVRKIIKKYSSPNLTFAEFFRDSISPDFDDPVSEFGEACRSELSALLAISGPSPWPRNLGPSARAHTRSPSALAGARAQPDKADPA